MDTSHFRPSETIWSEAALLETTRAFSGQLKKRAVALCVWVLASDPEASVEDVEKIAEQDLEIEWMRNGKKVSNANLNRARELLGLAPKKRRSKRKSEKQLHDKGLSDIEKAILDRYQQSTEVVEKYRRLHDELATVQQAYAQALQALRAIPEDHAITLADVDDATADLLRREGVLPGDEAVETDEPVFALHSDSDAVWPAQ